MSDEWIKMRCNLADDPAVIAIACAVKTTEAEVVGLLHRLWAWADQHTPDGFAANVTAGWVDRHVGKRGFAAAMTTVHPPWLGIDAEGITFPHFDRHNGATAKRRAQDKKQKKWERENGRREDVPPDKRRKKVRKMSASEQDENQTSGGPEVEVEVEVELDSKALNPIVGLAPDDARTATEKPKINGHASKPERTQKFNADAREIIVFLNEKTGKHFTDTAANLTLVTARLREGFTPLQLRQVVAMKVREWKTKPEMVGYLRPETLFGAKKFSSYVGELGAGVPDAA